MNPDSLSDEIAKTVKAAVKAEADKPLVVAVMGQTGVGKSTLINRLFGTNLKTDPVKPCTKEVERVVVKSKDGSELWFYDMPGIGEAADVDADYLNEYRRILLESDIAMWAIHADMRSVTFDQWALDQIIGSDPDEGRDLLLEVIKAKQRYFFESLLASHAEMLMATTYNDSKWTLQLPGFKYTDDTVTYLGYLGEDETSSLAERYPEHSGLLGRLRESYSVVACSSLLRYNLTPLMISVLNKLGRGAVFRFGSQFTDDLSKLTIAEAKACLNIVVVDEGTHHPIDDMEQSGNKRKRLRKGDRR
jgi:energy-coupling factor transporter ATP-binding protein EcfA2